ncbi:MAG: hypothetical protein KAU21_12365 [Gammaproteobacteria bacterium]|nr:hypothetical protein [Gammaproteobacteria bacterium]
MSWLYLIPFTYFYNSRLRSGSVAFHFLFEWLPAIVLAILLASVSIESSVIKMALSYFAFISFYEIGYLANDFYSSHRESDGRKRGADLINPAWVVSWVFSRIAVFLICGYLLGLLMMLEWWSFYFVLLVIFTMHNIFIDNEYKTITFVWLSWLRFLAPVIFVIDSDYLLGVALGAGMSYSYFRTIGYMDSKGLLNMPGRKRISFRLMFFLMPIASVVTLFPYPNSKGLIILIIYYATIALAGSLYQRICRT